VNVSKIRFLEVPFPDMPAAVKSGRVDAATAVEPFVTASEADGARKLLSFFAGMQPKMTIAKSHHGAVRGIVGTYTKIPPAVAQKMKLPYWSTGLNRPSIELTATETQHFGYTPGKVDPSQLIWTGAAAG
jgi:NitT/TauT family transport system substrate-binding protein